MDIDKYLRFVADKVAEAIARNNLQEVSRILRLCSEVCLEKAAEADNRNIGGK